MAQLDQLVILLLPVIFVSLIFASVRGLTPGKLGWLWPTIRRRPGRSGHLRLGRRSLPTTIITQAVAVADVALLALSASTLTALGLPPAGDDHRLALAIAVIVLGLCLLLTIQLLSEPLSSIALFGIAAIVTLRLAQLEHTAYPLLASLGLMAAVLGPWPVGLTVLVIELGTIAQQQGPVTLTMVLALIATLTALGLLVKAARGTIAVLIGVAALVGLAVLGVGR